MTRLKGLLTLEALRGMVAQGAVETVIGGFTTTTPPHGKRFDAEMFVEESRSPAATLRLSPTVDMEMEPVPGTVSRTGSWAR